MTTWKTNAKVNLRALKPIEGTATQRPLTFYLLNSRTVLARQVELVVNAITRKRDVTKIGLTF